MRLPGFGAEASLRPHGTYRLAPSAVDGQSIVAQLAAGGLSGIGIGDILDGLGRLWCRFSCGIAHHICLDGCEGTWENPKPSMNCVLCDQAYRQCRQGCDRA
jgi:hypothetical protein